MSEVLAFLAANPWAAWLAFGLISLLLANRSQVDAWAQKHPRVAGAMKLVRALGIDPWLLLQSLSLLVKGRLPVKLQAAQIVAAQEAPPPSKEVVAEVKKQSEPPPRMFPPPSVPPTIALLLGLSLLLGPLAACSAPQEKPPCSPADYAVLSATCGDDERACDQAIEDREKLCAERIRSGQ